MGDQRAGRGFRRRRQQIAAQKFRRRHPPGQKAHGGAFDIAFDAGDLACKTDVRAAAQAHPVVQERGGIDEGVAMDPAETGKAGVLQPRNHIENRSLRAILHLCLKADDVVECAQFVVAAQLHYGIGLLGFMRVGILYEGSVVRCVGDGGCVVVGSRQRGVVRVR